MRYVIAVCLLTGFLVWDAVRNDGRYLDLGIRTLRGLLAYVGVHV